MDDARPRGPRQEARLIVLMLALGARVGERPSHLEMIRTLRRIDALIGPHDPLAAAARRFGVKILAAPVIRLSDDALEIAGGRLMAALRRAIGAPSPLPPAGQSGCNPNVVILDDHRRQRSPRP